MKKILITGKSSYIGTSFSRWVSQYPDKYAVDLISLREDEWKGKSFGGYDAVLHTVGIAHVDAKPEMEPLYYKVNRDLAVETARKAKKDGVKQFVFLSSIIVYGESGPINGSKIIDRNTVPEPANFYGDSKLQAEEGIKSLESNDFRVAIVRPPMIYGKGSRGNYPKLARAARLLPVFPDVDNRRSMLHIDNLCEFLRLIIDHEDRGIFFPQNKEYVCTSEMVRLIAETHGKKIMLTKIFNPLLKLAAPKIGLVNKVFGSYVYERSLSEYKVDYRVKDLKQSIIATERQ